MHPTIFLLYHDIDSEEDPTSIQDAATKGTVVRLSEFKDHMAYLVREGYRTISIKQFLDCRDSQEKDRKEIVLTFDDGHISNYRYALPVLLKYGFSATFFIIAQHIGKTDCMGVPEIREMLNSRMEIGSHGLTHAYLTLLDQVKMIEEIDRSKDNIEEMIDRPVETFAYPGGHQNASVIKCVKEAGYRAAVSCIVGRNSYRTDPFLLRRIEIRRNTRQTAFGKALSPFNIRLFRCVDFGKSVLKNTVGLNRYQQIREQLYRFYPFSR